MQAFKNIHGNQLKVKIFHRHSDILPLFALTFVTSPDKHASFQELFSVRGFMIIG